MSDDRPPEYVIDLEVKLAFQDRLIRDLDLLVRGFAERLDVMQREVDSLKQTVHTGAPAQGAANEPPPHY